MPELNKPPTESQTELSLDSLVQLSRKGLCLTREKIKCRVCILLLVKKDLPQMEAYTFRLRKELSGPSVRWVETARLAGHASVPGTQEPIRAFIVPQTKTSRVRSWVSSVMPGSGTSLQGILTASAVVVRGSYTAMHNVLKSLSKKIKASSPGNLGGKTFPQPGH